MKDNVEVKAIGKMISTLSKSELTEIRGTLINSKEIELFNYFTKLDYKQNMDFPKFKKELNSLRNRVVNKLAQFRKYHLGSSESKDMVRKMNTEFTAFNNLIVHSELSAAAFIGHSIVEQSIKFQINSLMVPVLTFLRTYYSYVEVNKHKLNKFSKLLERYVRIYQLENRAKILHAEYMKSYIENLHPDEAIILGKEYLAELEPVASEIPSYSYKTKVLQIKIFLALSMKDYKTMRDTATEGFNQEISSPYPRMHSINSFLRKGIEASLLMRDFKNCEEGLKVILKNSKQGSTNWLNTLEILTILQLFQKDYTSAQETFSLGKKRISSLKTELLIIHRWGILEAYMNFLDLIDVSRTMQVMSRFKINRYINDTPLYTHDKKGRNIQIIIAQLLFLIVDKNWDGINSKVDSLQKYSKRYLKKDNLYRSSIFIKMLVEVPKYQANTIALERHSKKYLSLLDQNSLQLKIGVGSMEIIPYEDLWGLILSYLAKK